MKNHGIYGLVRRLAIDKIKKLQSTYTNSLGRLKIKSRDILHI